MNCHQSSFVGSPSPSKTMSASPAHIQSMRHPILQNQAMENASAATNRLANSAIYNQMQMNFDYSQNSNQQNGLELAGFCSPSGELHKRNHYRSKLTVHSLLGPASVASMSQCSSIQSPGHQQSPLHQSNYQQLIPNQQMNAAGSSKSFYQYLTPPSHNDSGSHTPPQHLVQTLDSYPTPSPESPGHWSSSQSPHSISDWSEDQSPANQNHYTSSGHQQTNKGSEAIYI